VSIAFSTGWDPNCALGLFTRPLAAIDGSKFKGVNARDKNFTRSKVRTRLAKLEERAAQYLTALDAADRQENMEGIGPSGSGKLRDKLTRLKMQMQKLKALEAAIEASPDKQVSLTDPDTRLMVTGDRLTGRVGYDVQTVTEHHLIVALPLICSEDGITLVAGGIKCGS
jgi:hypothetical protein